MTTDFIIFLIVLEALVVFLFFLFDTSLKRQAKLNKEKTNLNLKYEASISGLITHIEGLPIPKGVLINLFYGEKKITFVKEHQEITLDSEKIINVDIISGGDIQSQMTGAIAGKLILGGIGGATIGALISTKTYFIISYKKDDTAQSIIFEAFDGALSWNNLKIVEVVNDFKKNHRRETEKIDL